MKQALLFVLCTILALSCCACGQDVGIIGSADGPTTVIVGQQDQNTAAPQPETPPAPQEPTPPEEPAAPTLPTVSGELPDPNATFPPPHTTYAFVDVNGMVSTVALTDFDVLHDAVLLGGHPVYYLIKGGFRLNLN